MKITIFILTVLIALSPMAASAQSTRQIQSYHQKYGCQPHEWCHNALQMHREPHGLFGALGQYGDMLGVLPNGMAPQQNPLTHPNKWCPPHNQNCGYHGQNHDQGYGKHAQQGFQPQPNHYQQNCMWVTVQGQQQPVWMCQQSR